jgi:hypothetical protein
VGGDSLRVFAVTKKETQVTIGGVQKKAVGYGATSVTRPATVQ